MAESGKLMAGGLAVLIVLAMWALINAVLGSMHVDAQLVGASLGLSGTALPATYGYLNQRMSKPMPGAEIFSREQDTLQTIFWISMILLALVYAAAFIFGFIYAAVSEPMITKTLTALATAYGVQFSDADMTIFEHAIIGPIALPLVLALLAATSPLLGAWIQSHTAKNRHGAIGWGASFLFALANSLIGLFQSHDAAKAMGLDASIGIGGFVLGCAIVWLFTLLFMGIGYNLAKLFKVRA
ncbi:MAG: hypothetical protein ACXU8O_01525 [Asticcacaulis sp.]